MKNNTMKCLFLAFALTLMTDAVTGQVNVPELLPVDVLCPRDEIVGITADGKTYLTAGQTWLVKFRVADAQPIEKHFLGRDASFVRGMSADGNRVAVVSATGVFVYDTRTRSHVAETGQHRSVWAADISPDGRFAAVAVRKSTSGSLVGRIEIWDVEKQKRQLNVVLEPVLESVEWVKFSRDGKRLLVAARKPNCLLIDATEGKIVKTLDVQAYVTRPRGLCMGRDYGWIGNYENIRIVDMQTGQFVGKALRATGRERIMGVHISHDDKSVLIVRDNDCVSRLSLPELKETEKYRPIGMGAAASRITFSPEGEIVLVPSNLSRKDAAHHVVEFPGGREISSRSLKPPLLKRLAFAPGMKARSPRGDYVAGVSGFHEPLTVWQASPWKTIGVARSVPDGMVAVSADGRRLACAAKSALLVRSLAGDEEDQIPNKPGEFATTTEVNPAKHAGKPAGLTAISFSGNHLLATGHNSGKLFLWDARTGTLVKQLGTHGGVSETEWVEVDLTGPGEGCVMGIMAAGSHIVHDVLSLCGSSDGAHVWSSGKDGKLICWDLSNGEQEWNLDVGQTEWLVASPDDKFLAVAVLAPESPSQPARAQIGVVIVDAASGKTLARVTRTGSGGFKQGAFLDARQLVLDVRDALLVYEMPKSDR